MSLLRLEKKGFDTCLRKIFFQSAGFQLMKKKKDRAYNMLYMETVQ